MFRKIRKINLTIALAAFHMAALSYDSDALVNATGPYIISADLHAKLLRSKCAYASTRKAPSMEARYDEVRSTLNPSDRKELEDFYKSPGFRVRTDRNQQIIDDLYAKFSNGVDEKTACGMLWGALGPSFTKTENEWKRAKAAIKK